MNMIDYNICLIFLMTRLTDRKGCEARLIVDFFVGAATEGTRVSLKHRKQDTGVMIDPENAAGLKNIRVIDSQNP